MKRQHMAGSIAEPSNEKEESYEKVQPKDRTLKVFKKSIRENHQCHASPSAAGITWCGDTSAQWEDALVPLISW